MSWVEAVGSELSQCDIGLGLQQFHSSLVQGGVFPGNTGTMFAESLLACVHRVKVRHKNWHKVQKSNAPARTVRSGFAFRNPWKASFVTWPLISAAEWSLLRFEALVLGIARCYLQTSRQTVVCKCALMTSPARYFRLIDVSTNMRLQPHSVWSFFFCF